MGSEQCDKMSPFSAVISSCRTMPDSEKRQLLKKQPRSRRSFSRIPLSCTQADAQGFRPRDLGFDIWRQDAAPRGAGLASGSVQGRPEKKPHGGLARSSFSPLPAATASKRCLWLSPSRALRLYDTFTWRHQPDDS